MSRRNYVKKKLTYVNIHRVVSLRGDKTGIVMRGIVQPYVIDGIPEGFYSPCSDGILLPKRKRGERFIVTHTVMHETEL